MSVFNPSGLLGSAPSVPNVPFTFVNDGTLAIATGDCVFLTFSVTLGTVTVRQSATATDAALCCGIAAEDIGVGRAGVVVVKGFAYANVGSGTPAAGDLLGRSGTAAGQVAVVTGDATAVVGDSFAKALAAKGSATPYPFANAVPVWVY